MSGLGPFQGDLETLDSKGPGLAVPVSPVLSTGSSMEQGPGSVC